MTVGSCLGFGFGVPVSDPTRFFHAGTRRSAALRDVEDIALQVYASVSPFLIRRAFFMRGRAEARRSERFCLDEAPQHRFPSRSSIWGRMNKFDRILWRINGALLLAFLVFGILFLISNKNQPPPKPVVRPPGQEAGRSVVKEEERVPEKRDKGDTRQAIKLGAPFRMTGTPFLRLPMQSETESEASSSTEEKEYRVYNYLYVDATTLGSWWLFKTSDQIIPRIQDFRTEVGERERPIIATLFGVIYSDTDGDGQLTTNDREAIYFCTADGRRPFEIVPPSDTILSVEPMPSDQVMVVYQRGQETIGTVFSTQNGLRLRESTLSVGVIK